MFIIATITIIIITKQHLNVWSRLKNMFFYILFGLEQAGLAAAWYLATNR